MIRQNQKLFNFTLILIDSLIMCCALFLSWVLRFKTNFLGYHYAILGLDFYMFPLIFIIPLFLIIYYFFDLYTIHRHSISNIKEFSNIVKANGLGALVLVTFFFVIELMDYSRFLIFFFIVFNIILTYSLRSIFRIILRKIRSKGYNVKYVVVLGAGELGIKFQNMVNTNRYLGYKIFGYLDDYFPEGHIVGNSKVIGKLDILDDIISNNLISTVIIAISFRHYDLIQQLVDVCEKNGLKVFIIPDYYRYLSAKPYVDMIEDMPLINIRYVPLDEAFNKTIKRIFDILFSIFAIVITSPILIITSIAIKINSPGPIIFSQTRIGYGRKPFTMYKFRSMKVQEESTEKTKWTKKDDNRKTKVGTFIRKTSIDELPQFFNVLKGDMSVCGPRPERPYFVEQFRETIPKYMIKHQVRPGITGLAQSRGLRGDTSIENRIRCDIFYVENWRFWLDIKIVFLTIYNILTQKNAY